MAGSFGVTGFSSAGPVRGAVCPNCHRLCVVGGQTLELRCDRMRSAERSYSTDNQGSGAVQRPLDGRATHRPVGVVRPRLAVSRRYRGRDAPGERLCRGRVRLFLGWGSVQRSSRREVLPPCQRPPPRCVFPLTAHARIRFTCRVSVPHAVPSGSAALSKGERWGSRPTRGNRRLSPRSAGGARSGLAAAL